MPVADPGPFATPLHTIDLATGYKCQHNQLINDGLPLTRSIFRRFLRVCTTIDGRSRACAKYFAILPRWNNNGAVGPTDILVSDSTFAPSFHKPFDDIQRVRQLAQVPGSQVGNILFPKSSFGLMVGGVYPRWHHENGSGTARR
jgi:hypothetical protein